MAGAAKSESTMPSVAKSKEPGMTIYACMLQLEDLFNKTSSDPAAAATSTSIIMDPIACKKLDRFPELKERVLLFLPKSDQSRCRVVCKDWRDRMTSKRLKFDELSVMHQLAWPPTRDGYPVCMLRLKLDGPRHKEERRFLKQSYKIKKLHFAGLVLPPSAGGDVKLVSHAGIQEVVLACFDSSLPGVRCWVLNLARTTWRELPSLPYAPRDPSLLGYRPKDIVYEGMNNVELWMVPKGASSDFKLMVLMNGGYSNYLDGYFFTYDESCSSLWRVCHLHINCSHLESSRDIVLRVDYSAPKFKFQWGMVDRGEHIAFHCFTRELVNKHMVYVHTIQQVAWETGTMEVLAPSPTPFLKDCRLISDNCDGGAVFAYGVESVGGLSLYQLQLGSGGNAPSWKALFVKQLPPYNKTVLYLAGAYYETRVWTAHVVGEVVFILAGFLFTVLVDSADFDTDAKRRKLGVGRGEYWGCHPHVWDKEFGSKPSFLQHWVVAYHKLKRTWAWFRPLVSDEKVCFVSTTALCM